MGTTINGVYIPGVGETNWDVNMNAGLTNLANGRVTSRSMFLPASGGLSSSGTIPQVIGTTPSQIAVHRLIDTANSAAFWTFQMPSTAATAAMFIRPLWVPEVNDGTAHTVRWLFDIRTIAVGTDVTIPQPSQINLTGDSASRTANVLVLETGTSTAGTYAPGVTVRLNIQRLGGHANDTYVGTVLLLGVQLDYQSK